MRSYALTLLLTLPTFSQEIDVLIDSTGDGAGNVLDGPNHAVVDSLGNVYVGGAFSDNVFKITPAGVVTEVVDHTGGGYGLDSPQYLVVDSADNVYVAGFLSHNVLRISPAGVVSLVLDATGGGVAPLERPVGLAIDRADTLYVTGWWSNNVFSITAGGAVALLLDESGDGVHGLDHPEGIALDREGNLFVVGYVSGNVFKRTPAGVVTQVLDATGDGTNPLVRPRSVAVDRFGSAFVSDPGTHNVFKVDPENKVRRVLHWNGGALVTPIGVATHGLDLFVTGGHSNNVLKLDAAGVVTEVIDASGDGAGNPLDGPRSLVIDPAGRLLCCALESHNVLALEVGTAVAIGTSYCGPANSNSSGRSAVIRAFGDERVSFNTLWLEATQTAANQFGFFINSRMQAFVQPPGSQGSLCLGGAIGRHSGDVKFTGPDGAFELVVDLTVLPTPILPYPVQPGETWNWQGWFRDMHPGPTSNFTDGVSITWR